MQIIPLNGDEWDDLPQVVLTEDNVIISFTITTPMTSLLKHLTTRVASV